MEVIDDLDELTEVVTGRTEIYVRHSAGPEADERSPSRDYEADVDLPGLPVSGLRPETWWTRDAVDWVARRVCKYLGIAGSAPDRHPWILTGRVCGHGPDHEPLLVEVQPIAWIGERAVDQAYRHYLERFDVGRTGADV